MIVHIQQIDPEGTNYSGVEPGDILGLDEPGLKSLSPVAYDIHVGLSGGGIFATGRLSVDIDCLCVRCLQPFKANVVVHEFAMQEDLTGPETFDLSPYFREEIILALPAHPHCDTDGGLFCPGSGGSGPPEPTSQQGDDRWNALDNLKF